MHMRRARSARVPTLVMVLCLTLAPVAARAHGGLPISEDVLAATSGDELLVPTQYWGVFFGSDGGHWRWICEEAVNKYQARLWAHAGSGAYHVNDYQGVTSSRDGGCTWVAASGDIARRHVSAIVADPVDPHRAFATTDEGGQGTQGAPWNALFVTTDDGLTWAPSSPAAERDEFLRGVAISSDGKTIYVTGSPRPGSAGAGGDGGVGSDGGPGVEGTVLHVSHDGGASFSDATLDYRIAGGFTVLTPLGVDPADDGTLYLAGSADPLGSLVVVTGHGASLHEAFSVSPPGLDMGSEGPRPRAAQVYNVAFDASRSSVLAATSYSLWRSKKGGPFVPTSSLTRTQCVRVRGNTVYACAWNYAPDCAAIARSDDGGDHFTSVFRYDQTEGPTTTCAPSTPVGMICPGIWQMYADQLGVGQTGSTCGAADSDGGTGNTMPPSSSSCGCQLGSQQVPPIALAVFVTALAALLLHRRRYR